MAVLGLDPKPPGLRTSCVHNWLGFSCLCEEALMHQLLPSLLGAEVVPSGWCRLGRSLGGLMVRKRGRDGSYTIAKDTNSEMVEVGPI